MTATLQVADDGPVRVLTLNRPDKRNALDAALITALADAAAQIVTDPAVGAVVIAATGPAFCAGGDASAMVERTVAQQKTYLDTGFHRLARALHAIDRPVLAAVQGPAVGAGVDLCCFADFRYAAEQASFFVRYPELGLVLGDGAAWFLPRIVGPARALEVAWAAAPIDAGEALRLGLVTAVYPAEELLGRTMTEAHRLAALPPFAVRATKRLLRQAAESSLDTALELSSSQQALAHGTEERQRAAAALARGRTGRG